MVLLLKTDTTVRVKGRGRPWGDHEMKRTGVQRTQREGETEEWVDIKCIYTQACFFFSSHKVLPVQLSPPPPPVTALKGFILRDFSIHVYTHACMQLFWSISGQRFIILQYYIHWIVLYMMQLHVIFPHLTASFKAQLKAFVKITEYYSLIFSPHILYWCCFLKAQCTNLVPHNGTQDNLLHSTWLINL